MQIPKLISMGTAMSGLPFGGVDQGFYFLHELLAFGFNSLVDEFTCNLSLTLR